MLQSLWLEHELGHVSASQGWVAESPMFSKPGLWTKKKEEGKKQKGHQMVNNSKKPSQCRSDIYVNELQHPQ